MNDTEKIPQKRSVVFEALKSIVISIGVVFGIDALAGEVRRENLKSKILQVGAITSIFGAYDIFKTVKYNQEVDRLTKQQADSFTKGTEQEQAAKSSSLSAPAKSI